VACITRMAMAQIGEVVLIRLCNHSKNKLHSRVPHFCCSFRYNYFLSYFLHFFFAFVISFHFTLPVLPKLLVNWALDFCFHSTCHGCCPYEPCTHLLLQLSNSSSTFRWNRHYQNNVRPAAKLIRNGVLFQRDVRQIMETNVRILCPPTHPLPRPLSLLTTITSSCQVRLFGCL